jgi:hypothetical protein
VPVQGYVPDTECAAQVGERGPDAPGVG